MSERSPHPAAIPADALLAECETKRLRRSGPGGQNRNKVETAVVLRHVPTGIGAEANERRSQSENLKAALFRLRVNLALAVRTVEAGAAPGPLWRSRCRGGRIGVNPGHDDFPALLAEALDALAALGFEVKAAAERLDCSSSQLLKFLKDEPRAVALLNGERTRRGLRPLL